MIKKIVILIIILASLLGFALISSTPTLAQTNPSNPSCAENFLGFPVWYRGLVDDNCNVISPDSIEDGKFIRTLVMNIVEIAFRAVLYVSFFFVLFGGFKFLTSAGSADGISKAKSTISSAMIGLIISVIAVTIVNFIFNSFIIGATKNNMGVVVIDSNTLLKNALNAVYVIAGAIAVAMIIFAGLTYTTSMGDSKKVETAKNTITYSAIGLVVIILAFIITRFVIGGIK